MKITNLYTLSQFVDYLDSIQVALFMQWQYVKKYNEFLKQPLTKEMFVNEIEKPKMSLILKEDHENHTNYDRYKLWQEAEKKVIFEGRFSFKYYDDGAIRIDLYDKVIIILQNGFNKITLGEIAEKTNGELKTKNIEL